MANEARMRQPQNRGVLERSQFLNALFAQKSFSWTAVMMDLEKVLPTGVQVTSLEPQIAKDGDVIIRLRVSGDRDRAVQLVRNLETSQRFVAPRLAGEAAQAQEAAGRRAPAVGPGAVEFEILSGYNPLPADAAEGACERADCPCQQDGEGSKTGKRAAARGGWRCPVTVIVDSAAAGTQSLTERVREDADVEESAYCGGGCSCGGVSVSAGPNALCVAVGQEPGCKRVGAAEGGDAERQRWLRVRWQGWTRS